MITRKQRALLALVAATCLTSGGLWAQTTSEMALGEVKKIDKESQKITLKHGEIKTLEMPPMTMVFRVKDPALLDKAKPGDKVRFSAERREGAMVVTAMEAAPATQPSVPQK